MADVKMYTQAELEDLISCPKVVLAPPKKAMRSDKFQLRNDMRLKARDAVFMRINENFSENFSIGLVYEPNDGSGSLTLLRCVGPHGESNFAYDPAHPHAEYHVHRASEEAIREGRRPEKNAAKTSAFASYEEALHYFLRAVNAVDAEKHFPDSRQLRIELGPETRVGGKIHRVYDEPRTPYQRLLESGQINRKTARELVATYESPLRLCENKPNYVRA